MLMVFAEMVPMFKARVPEDTSVPTDISPLTVRAPALILPTVTLPSVMKRSPAVAVVVPSMVALAMLVLATKASSLEEGSAPSDQLAEVNQLPLVPIQLFVSAQTQSRPPTRTITTTAARMVRTRSHSCVRTVGLTCCCIMTLFPSLVVSPACAHQRHSSVVFYPTVMNIGCWTELQICNERERAMILRSQPTTERGKAWSVNHE